MQINPLKEGPRVLHQRLGGWHIYPGQRLEGRGNTDSHSDGQAKHSMGITRPYLSISIELSKAVDVPLWENLRRSLIELQEIQLLEEAKELLK